MLASAFCFTHRNPVLRFFFASQAADTAHSRILEKISSLGYSKAMSALLKAHNTV